MVLKTIIFVTVCCILVQVEVDGSPIEIFAKPPNCPHGRCFIDRCHRICSCVPNSGNTHCTKLNFSDGLVFKSLMDCAQESGGNCPLGDTYTDPIWPKKFMCKCNNDVSQTYECFDTTQQVAADPQELLKLSRAKSNVQQL